MNFFRSLKKKPATPYDAIGGQVTTNAIASTFYDIMESDPLAADLMAIHPKPLARIREVFALYLTMWLGGPDTYAKQFGHPRLRARHLPFTVTPALKEQWMYCMRKAMFEHVADKVLANQLLTSLNQLAEHMVNSEA
ncbi:group II truncated hemoglobin [Alteromonas ponticola]|uniref:Group II truncated hemoglobin n=1 Tax=Alteromonas ponticola TaxID=2720613 RepID=A0ABX1R3D5_9ALTE|nr:group II truncated hemoglobin [Alteromonas ponticola]NMH60594.1 group II truncated hemoglobin [Alteromonas ponticola]